MAPFFIRSTIFNLLFYVTTAIACIALLPTLLMPRTIYLAVVRGFVHSTAFLEKYILGLTYEVRGKEHVPREGSYIVAAKHQSAYETLKLHILFGDPAIVLKKELLKIPLWGKYLAKSDVIAIDRSSPKIAIKSIQEGAKHVAEQGRPMVIFPQGTRVAPNATTQEKPYKIGIIRMQEATQLPIIPLALNSGIFHPRHSWCKKPGRVIFEFLPPLLPSEGNASAQLKRLEEVLEEKSHLLMEEGQKTIPKQKNCATRVIIGFSLLVILWCINWMTAAYFTKKSLHNFLENLQETPSLRIVDTSPFIVSGFPFKLTMQMQEAQFETLNGETLHVRAIHAQSWPFWGMPITLSARDITASLPHWRSSLKFDRFSGEITHKNDVLDIKQATLSSGDAQGRAMGSADFSAPDYPALNLTLQLVNYEPMLIELVAKNIIKEKPAMFAGVALKALERDGVVTTTLTSQNNKIYLGPIRVLELPRAR